MLTDKDPATGEYRIPAHHLFRRLLLRDGGLCRPRPAGHDLSRALGLHLAARPADRRADGRAMRSASRWSQPDRDVRAVPGRADRPRRAARPAGLRRCRGRAALSRRLRGLHRAPRAHAPASARSPAGAARTATAQGRGAPNPDQLDALHRQWLLLEIRTAARSSSITSTPTRPIWNPRRAMGLIADRRSRSCCSSMSRRCSASASRRRATAPVVPPEKHRERIVDLFRPAAVLVPAVRGGARSTRHDFPLHAITQRPMQMYHSWGSQNAWLRQILGQNRLFMNRVTARSLGLADDDWVQVIEPCTAASRRRSS